MSWLQTAIDPATVTSRVDVVAIVGIIAGIVGTLLGAALGAWGAWKVQQRQLEHEDETRFHDRRLAVYAEFNDACGKTMASRLALGIHSAENMARVLNSFETLRLVASRPVVNAAMPVHAVLVELVNPQLTNPQAQALAQSLAVRFNTDMHALANAMRAELGISD